MNAENRLWLLVSKKVSGEATPDELNELEVLLKLYPSLQPPIEAFYAIWAGRAKDGSRQELQGRLLDRIQQMDKSTSAPEGEPAGPIKQGNAPGKPQDALIRPLHSRKATPNISETSTKRQQYLMLRHNFRIARRSILRAKTFSLINITGLAIGMASAILLLLWIVNEYSYDNFQENRDRIYQLYTRSDSGPTIDTWRDGPMLMGPTLSTDFPEVEQAVRTNWVAAFVFHQGDKHLETDGFITDPGFLQMFSFPLKQGNPATALSSPRSVVLTEKLAQKLYGDIHVIGRTLKIDSSEGFTVTGIMADPPVNTAFDFEYLLPWSYMKEVHWDQPNWESANISTYAMLKPGVTRTWAENRMENLIRKNTGLSTAPAVFLHPMAKWRLWSYFENGVPSGGRIQTVRLFAAIAGFILLIACINFMNMSTARSIKKAREVGIRKVSGAARGSLIAQFLTESVFVASIAGAVALVLVNYSIGYFNGLTGSRISIPFAEPLFWISVGVFVMFTGILAGSYPAWSLSSYQPIAVLKGNFRGLGRVVAPRKVLVVFQFTIAICFIICTIIIRNQVIFGQSRDAGMKLQDLGFVFLKGDMSKKYPLIRQELIETGAVTSVTRTNSPLTAVWNHAFNYGWPGVDSTGRQQQFSIFYTDQDFGRVAGLEIVAGRDLDPARYPTDSTGMLLSESALGVMGLKNPVGETITNGSGTWHVVGVVKDFIPGTPFRSENPLVIHGPGPDHWFGTMSMRTNPARATAVNMGQIEKVLRKYNPDYPFDYYFADDEYALKFEGEKNTARFAAVFAALAIFISCMGLFALAAYTAENRTREIGVRKVLGASVAGITALLSKEFVKLVLISFVIASPVAWWIMNSWLENYSYRVEISYGIFIVTGLLSLMISLLTVSFQSISAALANPVKSLRND